MTMFSYPRLFADVGGTNARFAIVTEPGASLSAMVQSSTGGDADFAVTVQNALRDAGWPRPKSFLLAVAGPVADRRATLTNAETASGSLTIDGPELARTLGLEQGLLFNDFEALCLALPVLPPEGLMSLGGGEPIAGEPMVVVGAGTGLGVGALLHKDGAWLPVASEGGHVDLGPQGAEEFALWQHLGARQVSAEDLLSGRGLVRLYAAVRALQGLEPQTMGAADITAKALQGEQVAHVAMQHFFTLLARVAGNMALAFCARGGVFIGGGIAPRLRDFIDASGFVRTFADKGAASSYLRDIPVKLITAPNAALLGLVAVAREPERYVLNLKERCWR